jgi:regulation of enolase protein 1 (concanavalin A-like superfamily)
MKNQPIKIIAVIVIALIASVASQAQPLKFSKIPHPLTWVNKPVSYKINPESIFIQAGEKTDMFRDPNVTYNTDNAPRLSFTADPNFVLTAEVHHDFISKWDGGAIVLEADKMNWIKFCFEKDYTGMHRVVSVVTKDISDDCNSVAISGNQVFYKIAKADNVITLYYSADGKKWFLIRHLQFNTTKPIKLGFMAQSPTGKDCKVTFSNVTYSTKKIKDPYTGE